MTPDGPEAPKSVWWLPMQQGRDMEKGGMVCGEMGWDGIGMVNGWDGMGWGGVGWELRVPARRWDISPILHNTRGACS